MRILTNGQNNFKIYQNSQFTIHRKIEDYLLINDIRNDQTSTIGELHYDQINPRIATIFTTDGLDKVVRNNFLNSDNRINYNLGYIPPQFTVTFDYKAGGGNGGDGGYFYFYTKGTQNPNDAEECSYYDYENDIQIFYSCDSFPNGKYINADKDGYRIHFDEYYYNEQLAVSWAGYQGGNPEDRELINTIGAVGNYPIGFDFADSTWRNIKIQFDDGFFNIFTDNILQLQATDNSFSSRDKSGTNFGIGGYIGGLNNYHYFKNFKFYNIII
jgi:hypothetical protein